MSFTIAPSGVTAAQVGGLLWKLTGDGVLQAPNSDGTGNYDAPTHAATDTLKIEIQDGPAKGGAYSQQISIVLPSGGVETKEGGTSLKHFHDTWSVGFRGVIPLLPTQVSFLNLSFIEDEVGAQATGWLIGLNGSGHNPSTVATVITSGNSSSGCEVLYEDSVFSGAIPGPNYGVGTISWTIPWSIIPRNSSTRLSIGSVIQSATSDATGKATIQKAGSATFSSEASDPTSDF